MIDIQFSNTLEQSRQLSALLHTARVRKWVRHALRAPHPHDQITIAIVDAPQARAINQKFRGAKKNYASNVLTFAYQHTPFVIADLVLCASVIAQEASAQNKSLEAHWAHLLIHGTLHAQGYEHEGHQRDALEMEALEVLLVQSLGYPNPY